MTRPIFIRLHSRLESRAAPAYVGLAALTCAAVLFCLDSAAQEPPPTAPFFSEGRHFDEQGGAALYANVCAACHQADAKGAVGAASYPSLAENKNLVSAAYVEGVLFNGLRGMPAIGRMMSDEQVADVINYLRTHFGNDYSDPVSAADVQAVRPQ
jgi:mono/diheme cytochrome c family protein